MTIKRWIGYLTHDGRNWGVLDRTKDDHVAVAHLGATMCEFDTPEAAAAWVREQRGEDTTADGREYRRLPNVYPTKEERALDKRLLVSLMEAMSDSIDSPSAMWGATEVLLTRRRIVREGHAVGADREATDGAGQDLAPAAE